MSNQHSAGAEFNRVEIILTKPSGERIEVDVDRNGIFYMDIESEEKCTMNHAQPWKQVPAGQKQYLKSMVEKLANSLSEVMKQ